MGNEQYVQHDWSPLLWALMLTGMVIAVLATMGLFLVMVSRACRATGPVPEPAALDDAGAALTASPSTTRLSASADAGASGAAAA